MPRHPTPPSKARAGIAERLHRVRARVDWMMLFPAIAAIAWLFGQQAVAMVLVVVTPLLLALMPRRSAAMDAAAAVRSSTLMHRDAVQRLVDDVLADCARRDRTTAVLLVQIDDLHVVDGEWGTDLSETVMDRIVQRAAAALRGQDSVIRSGDDCLTLVLAPTLRADLDVVMNIIDRVQAAIAEPISVGGRAVRVQTSVGICTESMAPSRSAAALLAAADCALRIARRQGDGAVRAFNPALQTQIETDLKLGMQIDDALDAGDIRPWFQPQIDTVTGHVAGFEALARWHHRDLGVLTPDRFLSSVASAGRMADMGDQILRAALQAMVDWDKAGLQVPYVAVNLSLEELCDPRLAERMIWQVDRYGLAPARVAVEILETVTLHENDETVVRNIDTLRTAGFQLDLDDFGTGAASIAHIARFGVHRIKLDQSFVRGIDEDTGKQRIVAAILSLAENLGIATLAEGVETPEERDALTRLGCPHLQGFGIARPMPFDDTLPWAQSRRGGDTPTLRTMQARGSA